MRTIVLLPLAALMVAAAGCGSEPAEQSLPRAERGAPRSAVKRDLTLVSQTLEVKTASRIELQPVRMPTRTVRPSRWAPAPRPTRVESKLPLVDVAAPSPLRSVTEPLAQPVSAANDRELLPGSTVTLIPVSSGPSTGADETDDFPAARGHPVGTRGGGACPGRGRGRGPGIGIATAPRPDFRQSD